MVHRCSVYLLHFAKTVSSGNKVGDATRGSIY
jgi:hypothetical protein